MDNSKSIPTVTRKATIGGSIITTSKTTISLDLVLVALSKTLFNPFVASLFPLGLRALEIPYSATIFIVTSVFSATVCVYHVLTYLDQRLAYGPPRKINWENEVIVITGGCGGLGGCLAEIYSLRGVSVAVLDIAVSEPDHGKEKEGVTYYRCDLYHHHKIEEAWRQIIEQLGPPTILINNAATATPASFTDHDHTYTDRAFRVNTISQFTTTQLFLKSLPSKKRGGTLVTISSVVAHLNPANLAAYSASKAALTSYHNTLATELARSSPTIKTILVAPGQLDTKMFKDMKLNGWLPNFVAPVVSAGELAIKIVNTIDQGRGGEIRLPFYAEWAVLQAALPMSVQQLLRWFSGIDQAVAASRGAEDISPAKQILKASDDDSSSLEDSGSE